MNKIIGYLTLFTSLSTLLCCALPALLVSIGLGIVMAGLASNIPGLIWISEHKLSVFSIAGFLLVANGIGMWLNRNLPCPKDPKMRETCIRSRRTSQNIYFVSTAIFAVGFFFAYVAPKIF